MILSGHLHGGAPIQRRVKIGASFATAGVPSRFLTSNPAGITPGSTTVFADSLGLAVDTGTYSATQGDAEGLVTVNLRPDAIIKALMAQGATAGTALTVLAEATGETAGTTLTDTDVASVDMTGGTVWRLLSDDIGGESRIITTHTTSTSLVVTVPFTQDIVLADQFLMCPWAIFGDGASGYDGVGHVQGTTNVDQADASIASGTGGAVVIFDLELNGRRNSAVLFILQDHQYLTPTN